MRDLALLEIAVIIPQWNHAATFGSGRFADARCTKAIVKGARQAEWAGFQVKSALPPPSFRDKSYPTRVFDRFCLWIAWTTDRLMDPLRLRHH